MIDIAELKSLPEWKPLSEAKTKKMALLRVRLEELQVKLQELADEVPLNTNGGWFSGGLNESFEITYQFTKTREDIEKVRHELAQLSLVRDIGKVKPGTATYGSIVFVRGENDNFRALRLVLLREQEEDLSGVEHVELGCPLASQLLGIEEGAEFTMGIGPNQRRWEVEAIFAGAPLAL